MQKTWTLTADMPPARLQAIVAEALPGQVQPGTTGGAYASVSVLTDGYQPPAWMVQIQRDYRDADVHIFID